VLAAMAMYSDLLFAVSGDPIDVRASIYEIIAANILFLKIKKKFLSWILHKKNKIFLAFPILEFIWKKKKFILCKYLFYVC
jgi:hypothetical protein